MVRVVEIDRDPYILKTIDDLYRQVWNHSIKERLIKHSSYKGYRGYVIISDKEEVLGFSYGYSSLSGQYYHDLLSKELGPIGYEKWLKDCFEFVELAVHPSHRHLGYGKLLVNRLLKEVNNKTTVLTTQVYNKPVRNLYQGLGWVVIKEPFIPNNDSSPYVIMGKVLI
ncbi:GNAT family N-acetyltransferase [Bacillus litorisediminis]|uniref:GNAT family N-acetyltransferase n=2 Tax=Bacillus litorisediminis TaxID=2922713 RepID=UPI001FAC97E2|nr:GNAT family N-acetyltransferase [Bacillus litorisediminis]